MLPYVSIGLALASVALCVFAWRELSPTRIFLARPTTPVRDLAPGPVEVSGQICVRGEADARSGRAEEAIRSSTGIACVVVHTIVETRIKKKYEEVSRDTVAVNAVLIDATGTCEVSLEHADLMGEVWEREKDGRRVTEIIVREGATVRRWRRSAGGARGRQRLPIGAVAAGDRGERGGSAPPLDRWAAAGAAPLRLARGGRWGLGRAGARDRLRGDGRARGAVGPHAGARRPPRSLRAQAAPRDTRYERTFPMRSLPHALIAACLSMMAFGCGEGASSTGASATAAATTKAPTSKPTVSATATAAASPAPPPVKAPPSDVPTAAASANLDMEGAEVDGFKLKTISCKVANANPFTAAAMFKPLAQQSSALDACVDKPTDVSLHLSVADKKVSDVRVAGAPTPEAAACIAKAIEGATWSDPLTCVLSLTLKAAK